MLFFLLKIFGGLKYFVYLCIVNQKEIIMYEMTKEFSELQDSAISILKETIKDRKNPSDYISDAIGINVLENEIRTKNGEVLISEITLLNGIIVLIDDNGQHYSFNEIAAFELFLLVDEINMGIS